MKLAYVLPVGRQARSAQELSEAWPHNQRILALLAERHGWQCHALWSGAVDDTVVQGPVVHEVSTRPLRSLRALRPDVVHLNGLVFARLALSTRAVLGRRVRIVAQHHGELPGSGAAAWRQRAAARLAIDRYLFCGLPGQADPWRQAAILRADTPLSEVLEASTDLADEPGRPTDLADLAEVPPPGRGEPTVLWVGRLQEGKDPLTALEAFDRFRRRRAGAQLWMVAGAQRPLEAEVRRRLPAGAHLVGPLPHRAMAQWYRAADVLLSTSHHEGSGYALIEAIASGCTPAVTDLPSHGAIAGDVATYFAPGDPAAAAEALERAALAASRPEGRALVRARFEQALRWEHVADQLHAAYRAG